MTELPAAGVGACAAAGAGGDLYIVIGRAPTASQFVAEQLRASLSVAQVHCTTEQKQQERRFLLCGRSTGRADCIAEWKSSHCFAASCCEDLSSLRPSDFHWTIKSSCVVSCRGFVYAFKQPFVRFRGAPLKLKWTR